MIEKKKKEQPKFEETGPGICQAHGRKLEVICVDHQIRICTTCALFGDHRQGCDFRQEEDVIKEITMRTELLIEIYELIEGTKQNFTDQANIEDTYKEFQGRQDQLKKYVSDTFKGLMNELKRKEERTMDILDVNFTKIEKKFKNIRDKPKSLLDITNQWCDTVHQIIENFTANSNQNSSYIAFEMLENQEVDIVREGEQLLEKLHSELQSPSSEDKVAINTLKNLIDELKVEFDTHFKNRITMLCHVPKIDIKEDLSSDNISESPPPQKEQP